MITTHIRGLEKKIIELNDFKQMLRNTVYTPAAINPDVFTDGGVTGHKISPK
jgi:hypothetical protein